MTPSDFKRIALSLEGVEEGSHMGAVDFLVGGRIFATLASQSQGFGNLALSPGQQSVFCEELPDLFLPIPGGWGRMGMTHIVLAKASEDVLRGALETAWRLRVEANTRTKKRVGKRKTRGDDRCYVGPDRAAEKYGPPRYAPRHVLCRHNKEGFR